jgi:hypothetical protein
MPILNKLARLFPPALEVIMRIGQMQLLRTKIGYELNNAAKFDSKQLFHALATFNEGLMSQVTAHFHDPANAYPDEDNPLLYELNPYLECVGLSEPMKKIYVTAAGKFEYIAFFTGMLILAHLAKLPSVKLTGLRLY